jgi:hypothetical protein
VSQLLLDISLIDFGRRSEASTKGMTGKLKCTLDLAKITANPGRHRGPLHQPSHFLVIQPFWPNRFALSRDPTEEGTVRKLGELDPGLDCRNRAGGV